MAQRQQLLLAWKQEPPVGRELFEVERGEVAYWITGSS